MFASIAEPDRLKQAMLAFGADIKCEVVHIWPALFRQMKRLRRRLVVRRRRRGGERDDDHSDDISGQGGTANVLATTPGGANVANTLYTHLTPALTVTFAGTRAKPATAPTVGATACMATAARITL